MSLERIDIAQALELFKTPGALSALIDARSPAEFEHDRLPGAVNWPSLNRSEEHTSELQSRGLIRMPSSA